jgi:hypothetical protein
MKKEYKNELGQLHRTDGPAVEWNNGDKWWYINGKYHRTDGPAIENDNGNKYWFIKGKFHREDGPAVEWSDGRKYWYLNNIKYTEEEFHQELIKLKLKRIVQL